MRCPFAGRESEAIKPLYALSTPTVNRLPGLARSKELDFVSLSDSLSLDSVSSCCRRSCSCLAALLTTASACSRVYPRAVRAFTAANARDWSSVIAGSGAAESRRDALSLLESLRSLLWRICNSDGASCPDLPALLALLVPADVLPLDDLAASVATRAAAAADRPVSCLAEPDVLG